jgi:hypothetical protein
MTKVRTSAMAYLSQDEKNYPIRLGITQSVWDKEDFSIVHQTSTNHSITKDEALVLISVLTKALEDLG